MDQLIEILISGHHSLVIEKNGEICTFDRKGIADLYALIQTKPGFLEGAKVADKVVGKGAAAIMVLGKVSEIYAAIISIPALKLIEKAQIKVSYGISAPNIINRSGTDICPVEKACLDAHTPELCWSQIENFMENNTKNKS